jgi:hypothetical protein
MRAKTIDYENLGREIKTAIGQSEKKELSIIKEKIERIKTLESKYKSPEHSLMKIYDKI